MNLIKVTNGSHEHRGQEVYVNIEHIESIHVEIWTINNEKVKVTMIETKSKKIKVEETIEEVLGKINYSSKLNIR